MNSTTLRLDQALVARGLVESRARARDAILRGHVRVDGRAVDKPSLSVPSDAELAIDDPAAAYVSRAALKLVGGLGHFGYDPAGRIALDVGASTGGFTQVLLERGVERVHAIDVGHDQMHPKIAADPRVKASEGLNARDLIEDDIGEPFDAIVCDVSFISLRLALPPALELAAPGSWAIILVKPQFEVGKGGIGKGGIVRFAQEGEAAAEAIARWIAEEEGWIVDGLIPSPIEGGDGNREFLLGARKETARG
ncbi:TlyA family RNA methyltransferase [Kaistia dalseonensis]|uniref:23S rRNA (Cytidine1920-2'-O)/16S rRNA (Cytidine1409-2'-O)-methyltransferase n=1 Tax=Kaistia dalseonensis TaxID=410840 RepID=A0ABU0HDV4_9HYPH|nr:TlyA family RNA methyltransferase [Kaistia dalseonensis]MCX5497384.1 TlyA family RNA methyltransferase [Kaistia dalseonensis]MDQ0440023.1 23S rRNA (cytidine1920-2'-O)/16S rRNA (cytidine1409-2'-O)-methyltransferase [Kaistia dalseonensis]